MDIKVIRIDPLSGRITLELQATMVVGIEKLIQIVVLSLLSSPGTDLLDPEKGAGLQTLVGYNFDPTDYSEISAEISRRVSKAEAEILSQQVGSNVSAEEKLSKLEVVSVKPGELEGEVDIKLRVTNELGRTRDVVI